MIVDFLTDMFNSGYGYSAINTARQLCLPVHERRVQLEAEHSASHPYMGRFYWVKLLKNAAGSGTQLA